MLTTPSPLANRPNCEKAFVAFTESNVTIVWQRGRGCCCCGCCCRRRGRRLPYPSGRQHRGVGECRRRRHHGLCSCWERGAMVAARGGSGWRTPAATILATPLLLSGGPACLPAREPSAAVVVPVSVHFAAQALVLAAPLLLVYRPSILQVQVPCLAIELLPVHQGNRNPHQH